MELSFDRMRNQYVVVNHDILDTGDFMYPTYQQLIKALDEVVQRSDHEQGSYDGCSPFMPIARSLYLYGNNVIAISGRRGEGKTSVMLSFSDALTKAGRADGPMVEPLVNHSFVVLDPIDPTVLETKQSPLMLILSRMYRKVEEVWERSLSAGGRAVDQSSADSDRRRLVDQFQKCFSGIREVKSGDGDDVKTLASLHTLSDSSLLKANFYELVCSMLEFCGDRRSGKRSFLVIQLDDTDFQIGKGYEVLDDIRKYLTLPNVIILMATDMSLMHKVVAQHFAQELGTAIERKLINVADIENNASKYLDKLVPPSQVVHLPSLGLELGRVDSTLRVSLLEDKGSVLPVTGEEYLTLENTVLRFLYRKTGILCVSEADQAHGFVPTTLRGLMQLLNLLASLEDIPPVPNSATINGRRLAFARALREQLVVKESNLRIFEDYLLHTWVNAKFSAEAWLMSASDVRRMLAKLADEAGLDDTCHNLVRELNAPEPNWDSVLEEFGVKRDDVRSIELLGQMGRCFIAAVNIAVALRWHKAVVREMRSELPSLEKPRGRDEKLGPYAFNLWHEVTGLPKDFAYDRRDWGTDSLQSQIRIALKDANGRGHEPIYKEITDMMAPDGEFRILHLVQAMLSMGKAKDDKTLFNLSDTKQREVYESQVAAIVIACSPELQTELIRVEEARLSETRGGTDDLRDGVNDILARLDACERAINSGQIGDIGKQEMVAELVRWRTRIGRLVQWTLPGDDPEKDGALAIWFSNLFARKAAVHTEADEGSKAGEDIGGSIGTVSGWVGIGEASS